ncbi:MAG TPA: hypothetical protein PKV10_08405 [Thermoanaerobaculia bacterium]|nr:hypothetical protein [Thermoanaerobaculia bacterium]
MIFLVQGTLYFVEELFANDRLMRPVNGLVCPCEHPVVERGGQNSVDAGFCEGLFGLGMGES